MVQDETDENVEGDPEEVDDGRPDLLWHMLAAHLHHAGPEQAHHELKAAKRPPAGSAMLQKDLQIIITIMTIMHASAIKTVVESL